MTKPINIPTAESLAEWREMIYEGDTSVTMQMAEFERLMHAAELLLRVRDRARACYVDYDKNDLTRDTWVYIIAGVDPHTAHDFIEDLRRADNDQSAQGSTCPGCHCVLYDDAALRGWCRDCALDQEPE